MSGSHGNRYTAGLPPKLPYEIVEALDHLVHWEAKDNQKIQDFNYRATKEAIARAVKGEPKASEVTAKKDTVHHPFAAS